jgi:hypothetical protein
MHHERDPPVTCNAAVTCNGAITDNAAVTCNALGALQCSRKLGSARTRRSTLRWERLGRLILRRAERVADEVINGALDRRVYVPTLGLQESLFNQTIDLRVG